MNGFLLAVLLVLLVLNIRNLILFDSTVLRVIALVGTLAALVGIFSVGMAVFS